MLKSKKWRSFWRNFLSSFMVIVLVASCASIGPDSAQTSEQLPDLNTVAAGEKAITVYTALEDDQIAKYLPLFQKQHPDIKVNIVRDSTGVVTAKMLAEKDNPQADAIWGLAVSSLLVADKQGILQPYAPKGLDKVQPNFKDNKNPPHWVGIDAWMSAFCVNTEVLKEKNLPMPTSWADLTKPEYKGQIVMSNPASSGTGFLSVAGILQLKGEEKGWKYLDALDKNVAQYLHSGSKPCKVAATGEYAIGVSFDYRAVKSKNSGEPIAAVFPKEGSGWDIEANALVKKPKMKEEAKLFLDWAITPEIAKEYAKNFPVTAVKTDVPIPEGYPQDLNKQLIKNDFQWSADNRDRILAEWNKRFDSKSEKKS